MNQDHAGTADADADVDWKKVAEQQRTTWLERLKQAEFSDLVDELDRRGYDVVARRGTP